MANEGITTIRLHASTKARIAKLKDDDETFEEFLVRKVAPKPIDCKGV